MTEPAVRTGHRYAAFLVRVSFAAGTTTGEWAVVGAGAGLYELRDGKAIRLDDDSPQLPAEPSLAEFEAAVRTAG